MPFLCHAPTYPTPNKLTTTTTGNIRRAEHFISFLRRFVSYLAERMNAPAVVSEGPAAFLAGVQQAVAVDAKTLRCLLCYVCVFGEWGMATSTEGLGASC